MSALSQAASPGVSSDAKSDQSLELALGSQSDQYRPRQNDQLAGRIGFERLPMASPNGKEQRARPLTKSELAQGPPIKRRTALDVDFLDSEVKVLIVHHNV